MLQSCSATASEQPAAVWVRERLEQAARLYGVPHAFDGLDRIIAETFADTTGRAYAVNQLQPGALPIEWSFSEEEPDSLRFEIQPFDPALRPAERLLRVGQALSLASSESATRAAQPELTSDNRQLTTFGAFLGLSAHPTRPSRLKVYLEIPNGECPLHSALAGLSRVVPHFRSVAITEGDLSERTYYLATRGLDLGDLEQVCAALGMAHRFPGLVTSILELTGGAFFLPPKSALLGIRESQAGAELKIELVVGAAAPSEGIMSRIERMLQPDRIAAFHRWAEFAAAGSGDPRLTVVSVRVAPACPTRLSVYAADPWVVQ